MKNYILIICVSLCAVMHVEAQDINYEAFEGTPVKMKMEVPLDIKFIWNNRPGLTEERKERLKTIKDDEMDYATSPKALLTKLYLADSKKEIEELTVSKQVAKRFKVKKVKNYEDNHLRIEYNLQIESNKDEFCIIKYSEIVQGKIVETSTLQAIWNKGWKVAELPELDELTFIVENLSAEQFLEFYRTGNSDDEDINRLRQKVRTPKPDNRLNLTTLAEVLKEVQQNDPQLWKKLTE